MDCDGLCSRFDEASNCRSCVQGLDGELGLLEPAWSNVQFWRQGSCGPTCLEAANEVNAKCTDEASCKTAMCSGDAKSKLDQCMGCYPTELKTENHKSDVSILSTIADLCTDVVVGPTCYDECTAILATDMELCEGGDTAKRKGLCTAENLSAMSSCNLWVGRPDFQDKDGIKDDIGKYRTELVQWCKDDGGDRGGGGDGGTGGAISIGGAPRTSTGATGSGSSPTSSKPKSKHDWKERAVME
ncbi:hypothetical protein CspeluHIS016_0211740 [Cutaneotrichosporon spelunceum]|uniref:Uncharacterized protein n=1 Tax=Cutaneotrichosporon spelunceum TaxID=1672016 RepID=A0AAD3TSZ5_9TREE|nr:hypothetical protein CspeluHIS016_0211740 [Cutaneotrichosporon spelunceum]